MVLQTIRQLTVTEWRDLIVKEIENALDRKSKNCLNCENWRSDVELCGKFNARPPAHIIVNACPDHEEEIPF